MVQPIKNNIVVKPFKGQERTEGGLFIPESCQKESDKVEVIRVGSGTAKKPMKLKPGDIGFRVHEWGTPFEENGETYYLMADVAIIALA